MNIGCVLVHCAGGISRSTTCAIAFLMKEYSWSFEKTLEFVRSKKPNTNPNFGFVKQLISYEEDLRIR